MFYYSCADIAESYAVSIATLKKYIKQGLIKAEKFNTTIDDGGNAKIMYLIPETELVNLPYHRHSELTVRCESQPIFYDLKRLARYSRYHALHNSSVKYDEYMQSDAWKSKREQRICFDEHHCRICGAGYPLVVHHITYEMLGDEAMDDLITLCRRCHEAVHGLGDGGIVSKSQTASDWLSPILESVRDELEKRLPKKSIPY